MTFVYVSGRSCLEFVGTMKRRHSSREELLTEPELLSDWAVQAGLLDVAVDSRAAGPSSPTSTC